MRRVSVGHFVLDEGFVQVVEWNFHVEGKASTSGEDALDEWNYFADLRVSCVVSLGVSAIYDALGIPDDQELAWVLVARSTSTPLITASSPFVVKDGIQEVAFDVPSSALGGILTVDLEMGVSQPTSGALPPFAPSRVGHTVFRTSSKVALEGDAGQLPILPVSFKNHGIKNPASSWWWLRVLSSDLLDSANSALWMWLNTDSDILRTLIEQPDSEAGKIWVRFLKVDFVRQLLRVAMDHPDLGDAEEYPEGSMGALLIGVIKLVGSSVEEVKSRYFEDAGLVEANLQGAVNGGES